MEQGFCPYNEGFKSGAAMGRAGNRFPSFRESRDAALLYSRTSQTRPARVAPSQDLLDLELPAQAECLERVRHAVSRIAEELSLSDDDSCDLLLAVGEACNNAILHGSGSAFSPLKIRCRLVRVGRTRKARTLEIEIANAGNSFLPAKNDIRFSMPEAEELAGHGRGLPLMRRLMDDVQVFCDNGNTVVRLTKKISL